MSDSNSVMRCRPAGAGKQCAAAFVDCGFVLLCGVIAALLGHNIPVTFLVMLESVAVLAIGEGSRGLTPGNMMFGLRTVRVEGMRDVTAGNFARRNGPDSCEVLRAYRIHACVGHRSDCGDLLTVVRQG